MNEAANTIGASTRDRHPDIDWQRITRFRILLAHHYHRVDPDQVWTIRPATSLRSPRRLGRWLRPRLSRRGADAGTAGPDHLRRIIRSYAPPA